MQQPIINIVGDAIESFRIQQFLKIFNTETEHIFLNSQTEIAALSTHLGETAKHFDNLSSLKTNSDHYFIVCTDKLEFKSRILDILYDLSIPSKNILLHREIFSDSTKNLITDICKISPWRPENIIKELLLNYPDSGLNLIKTMAKIQNSWITKQLDKRNKTVAVYYPSKAYRSNLGSAEMYETIRTQGYNVIFLFGTIGNDAYESNPHSFYAGNGILEHMDFIDVIIYPTLTLGLPETAIKVLVVHDIYDSPKGKAEAPLKPSSPDQPARVSPLIDELDYNFLPSPTVMPQKKISTLVRKKPLCRIPGGYFKLDRNIRYAENYSGPVDSIIYAPTVVDGIFEDYVSLPKGIEIIQALLEHFDSFRIIFRPHPHTVKTDYTKRIKQHFSYHKRFVFDDQASFYMNNYCRSKTMVSDMSGTAFTYAFTTLRPVVFFSHKEDTIEEAFGNVKYFQDRKEIGFIAENAEDLKRHCLNAIENHETFHQKIRRFREISMYNIGHSEAYFAQNFHYIADRSRHPDWQYVVSPIET